MNRSKGAIMKWTVRARMAEVDSEGAMVRWTVRARMVEVDSESQGG